MKKNCTTIQYILKYRILICFLAIVLTVKISAQENPYKLYSTGKVLKMAYSAQQIGDYYNAIDLFNYYISKKEGTIDIYYQLAENYRKSRNYINAAANYKKVIDLDANKFDRALFYYADMLMCQANYTEALKAFEQARKKKTDKELGDLIKQRMDGCKLALQENLSNQRIRIVHPDSSINHENSDLSPVFAGRNKIIYSSIKKHGFEKYSLNASNVKLPVAQFYTSDRIKDTVWTKSTAWNFNDETMHVGNGAFTPDGNRFYFTKCQRQWDNTIQCAIYYSDKGVDGWSAPIALDNSINLPGYTATQVTVGRDSKRNKDVIYFVSDRPLGKGGMDIWYTVYNLSDGKFSKPVNAGPKINTKGNEVTPYFDFRSGTLYFSSDYAPGYGGFDVFMCTGEQKTWSNPVNLGNLINTGNDELYYTINPYKRNEGLFVSNRKGGYSALHETCCDDIYYFSRQIVDRIFVKGKILQDDVATDSIASGSQEIGALMAGLGPENITIDSAMIRAMAHKSKTEKELNPLSKALVSVYMIDSQTMDEMFIYSDSTNEAGEYTQELEPLKNYKIVVKKDEYFNQNIYVSTKNIGKHDTITLQDIAMKPVPRKPIKITVHYDVNSDRLNKESTKIIDSTLLTILKESPELIIEISSHTDDIGEEGYNLKLSQKRAEIVLKYLVEKGIEKGRLIAKGYGESKPLADNATEEGRSRNRRTEFKIVGSTDQFSKLNNSELSVIKKK
jgi:outer membrane protein OmpA-like peptidoglycan-associated protein